MCVCGNSLANGDLKISHMGRKFFHFKTKFMVLFAVGWLSVYCAVGWIFL